MAIDRKSQEMRPGRGALSATLSCAKPKNVGAQLYGGARDAKPLCNLPIFDAISRQQNDLRPLRAGSLLVGKHD
jgi:hypothetical protein